jgi:outer membrane protein TolC
MAEHQGSRKIVKVSAIALGCLMLAEAACVHAPPKIDGVAPTPANPATLWTPSSDVKQAAAHDVVAKPASLTNPAAPRQYSLAEVVDVALRNSPATRLSYNQALAAADVYGSSQGRWFPTVSAGIAGQRSLSVAAQGQHTVERTQYGPTLSLQYTVLDFGGRNGSIDVARQTAVAADLTHNATVENTILLVESAAFNYLSTRAQREAQVTAVDLASKALDAANERHRVGLATIADVLQAETAHSQAQLQLQTLEGQLQVTRGALAVAMGLPANASFDVPDMPAVDSVHFVAESVDTLIDLAVKNRPELAAARAQAAAASSQIRVARSGYLPALAFTGTGGNTRSTVSSFQGNSYNLNLGVSVPVFSGFSNQYDVAAASQNYQAALARTEATKAQVIQTVFNSYYLLRTATNQVRTSRDLLASATKSEEVARERYKEGVGTIVDLLIAQAALASAQAQAIDARWDWRTALAQLAHDVGVLNARGDTTFSSLTPVPDVRPDR